MSITNVQHKSVADNSGVSSLALTVSSTGANNLLVAQVSWSLATTITSIKEGAGSPFTMRTIDSTLNHQQQGYIKATGSQTTVTVVFSGISTGIRLTVWEFSTDTSDWNTPVVDGNGVASGTTPTQPTSASVPYTAPAALCCGVRNDNSSQYTTDLIGGGAATSDPTEGTSTDNSDFYRIMTTGSSTTGTVGSLSGGSGINWATYMCSYSPSAGAADNLLGQGVM